MADKASGSKTVDLEDVAEMMERLGLLEDDLDDVVFEEQEAPPPESIRWMALQGRNAKMTLMIPMRTTICRNSKRT